MGDSNERFPARLRWLALIGVVGLAYGLRVQDWLVVGLDVLFLSVLAITVVSGRASRVPENILGVYARFLLVRLLLVAPLALVAWLGVLAVTGSAAAAAVCSFAILFGGYVAEIWWYRRREPGKTD